ncbi:phage terminase large subunit [Acidiphilium sp.]|uniref:phage terminase large subunit n=1 Tax=Acidiphilium sp. TaxID=527 RepID=UPI00258F7805|nr:phage terminase large subunit [Acidiphilium sp.]
MATARIELPPKLVPLFSGRADVRAAHGGRGSGKTRSMALMAAVVGYQYGRRGISGLILCARQYMNSLEDSSLEEVKRAIESVPFLAAYYEIGEKFIRSRDGRIHFTFAGLHHNIASIKSKGRILLCWVDEAEPVTDEAWTVLIPTLREEGEDWSAELWVSWNPKRKKAAVESRFRLSSDPMVKCVEINWRDNPKFPAKLERDRQRDLAERPEQYDHIWEGAYATIVEGAYFAEGMTLLRRQNRFKPLMLDPLLPVRVYHDLAFSNSDKADAYAMWVTQFVDQQMRYMAYYETQGQSLQFHVEWLRKWMINNGRRRVELILPHDGSRPDGLGMQYAEHWMAAADSECDWSVRVVPNQGKGAAMQRVEAARRNFHRVWFNEGGEGIEDGVEALVHYHEKRSDDERDIGLGPNHDWSSHGADAFGLSHIDYEERGMKQTPQPQPVPDYGTTA